MMNYDDFFEDMPIEEDVYTISGHKFKWRITFEDGLYCAETRLALGAGAEDVHYGKFLTLSAARMFVGDIGIDAQWDLEGRDDEEV